MFGIKLSKKDKILSSIEEIIGNYRKEITLLNRYISSERSTDDNKKNISITEITSKKKEYLEKENEVFDSIEEIFLNKKQNIDVINTIKEKGFVGELTRLSRESRIIWDSLRKTNEILALAMRDGYIKSQQEKKLYSR
ncbi:MAG TPA: hypothetical protein QKA14_00830 [Candidatus Megaira endosymbiont of Hartmannula sinica]|nr:hypothetical protein [Candidatus Megaera endosymbiont of Hartmannula sinica]